MTERVAIIGAGVAGLTAGHLLAPRCDVHLFEKTSRIGGNAYTYTTAAGEDVDIAVAAFGKAGYPNFYKLIDQLGVKTEMCRSAYMSFHNLDSGQGIYLTPRPAGLWAQRFRILRPKQLATLARVLIGLSRAQSWRWNKLKGMTMQEALEVVPELSGDARDIFLCSLCLLSSMSGSQILEAPAEFFLGKLATHNDVMSPRAVYSVRAIRGRTRSYVEALSAPFRHNIHLDARIAAVRRSNTGVDLIFEDGGEHGFDHVVFACPADAALRLLADPTRDESELLGVWKYKDGRVVLHRDHSSFPAWHLMQAYVFLYTVRGGMLDTSVNGTLRHEPGVSERCDLISSQNPNFSIAPRFVEAEVVLRTPIFDRASCATIDQLGRLNGVQNTYYCGSHFGHGLHEDAVRSAVDVSRSLGARF